MLVVYCSNMFEIFDPKDRTQTVIARVPSEFRARLFVLVANKGRKLLGLSLLDYSPENEPWLLDKAGN